MVASGWTDGPPPGLKPFGTVIHKPIMAIMAQDATYREEGYVQVRASAATSSTTASTARPIAVDITDELRPVRCVSRHAASPQCCRMVTADELLLIQIPAVTALGIYDIAGPDILQTEDTMKQVVGPARDIVKVAALQDVSRRL